MAFRFRRLAVAAGAVALPAALLTTGALTALLPATAQAATAQTATAAPAIACSTNEVSINFSDGGNACQGIGLGVYSQARHVRSVCAGTAASAVDIGGNLSVTIVDPGTCASVTNGLLPVIVLVLPAL